jgi:hypothetical protein
LTGDGLQEIYQWTYDCEDTVSYLPLSHVAGTFIGNLSLTLVSLGRYDMYYPKRMEGERGNRENVSALSAGVYTNTCLVMVS